MYIKKPNGNGVFSNKYNTLKNYSPKACIVFNSFLYLCTHVVQLFNYDSTMNPEADMIKWWSSLTIKGKVQVSGKEYPECSVWWNSLSLEEKLAAKDASGIERAKRNKTKGFT